MQWSGVETQSKEPWNTMGNVETGGNNIFDPQQQQHQQQGGQGGQEGWGGQ